MRIGPLEIVVVLLVLAFVVFATMRARVRRPVGVELAEIFGETSTPLPGTKARTWAYGVLNEAGVDADADPLYAMKILRQAEPRLSLGAAKVLIDTLNRY